MVEPQNMEFKSQSKWNHGSKAWLVVKWYLQVIDVDYHGTLVKFVCALTIFEYLEIDQMGLKDLEINQMTIKTILPKHLNILKLTNGCQSWG